MALSLDLIGDQQIVCSDMAGSCRRTKFIIFLPLTLTIIVYTAYTVYLVVATRIERIEICEKLNLRYKDCDLLKINPKREILQGLLNEWVRMAKRNNISYVLSSGSLLGQYRNGDIIPWDIDVDVLLKENLLYKLKEIATPRDFVQGADNAFHFVVQPEYGIKVQSQMRRWNCNGQVFVQCTAYGLKYFGRGKANEFSKN